jgi:hypothetical protein
LLGEKQLAVMGELLLARVAGDQREEVRHAPIPLRPQDPPEPLRHLRGHLIMPETCCLRSPVRTIALPDLLGYTMAVALKSHREGRNADRVQER